MLHAVPSRFRHPLREPDPALVRQFRALFGPLLPSVSEAQVELLARSLSEGDPLADAFVGDRRTARDEHAALFERALCDGLVSVRGLSRSLEALVEQLERVPRWLDPAELERGAQVFRRTGMIGQLVLADFGLMAGYGSSAVVKPLAMTGELQYNAARRLIQTGRFVTAVTDPGALAVGGAGYRSAVRVRMVHAYVRAALQNSERWRSTEWGLPINQADMLATNLLFSIGLVEGCRKLGVLFRRDEVDAVVHLWRYIGYLVGVDERLLPVDEASAKRAFYLVAMSQPPPDADSVALARALHHVPLTFARSALARRVVNAEMRVRVSFTRRMLGDEAADALGLPRSRLRVVVPAVVALVRALELGRCIVPGGDRCAFELGDAAIKRLQRALDRELARG